jgi:hypothetical protein
MNSITVNFVPCEPPPANGYNILWRVYGSSDEYTDAGNFTESPAVFTDDTNPAGTDYEGFIRSDCGESAADNFGSPIPWSTFIPSGGGGEDDAIQCNMGELNPFAGTLVVTKNGSAIGIVGTIICITCPCNLNTGTNVARTSPSSPCNPFCDVNDLTGNWTFGETGYLTYIGPSIVVGCEGLEISLDFTDCLVEV